MAARTHQTQLIARWQCSVAHLLRTGAVLLTVLLARHVTAMESQSWERQSIAHRLAHSPNARNLGSGVVQTMEPVEDKFPDSNEYIVEDPGEFWATGSSDCEGGDVIFENDMATDCLAACGSEACWKLQCLPDGLIYRSYLAGPKEPRFAAVFWHDKTLGWQLDYTVGGRVPLLRYGTQDAYKPEGFQIDLEGAAFPRVNLDHQQDLEAADFRVGVPFTYGVGRCQYKVAYYHLSAHAGDEFLLRNPTFERINYVRDALVLGVSTYPIDPIRLYAEVGWAFNTDGGAEPWEFQFGAEYSPLWGLDHNDAPFVAINTYLREELDFGGSLNVQAGWQWRGSGNRHLLRTGLHYQVGKSNQFEFFRQNEQQLGIGLWYDF